MPVRPNISPRLAVAKEKLPNGAVPLTVKDQSAVGMIDKIIIISHPLFKFIFFIR